MPESVGVLEIPSERSYEARRASIRVVIVLDKAYGILLDLFNSS